MSGCCPRGTGTGLLQSGQTGTWWSLINKVKNYYIMLEIQPLFSKTSKRMTQLHIEKFVPKRLFFWLGKQTIILKRKNNFQ